MLYLNINLCLNKLDYDEAPKSNFSLPLKI